MYSLEGRLVILASGGNRNAFVELVNMYKDKIYDVASRMLKSGHDAEEVVTETFILVHQNLNNVDLCNHLKIWIFKVAMNSCLQRLRKQKEAWIQTEASCETGCLTGTQQQVNRAIDALPEKHRMVVILFYCHHFSLGDVSKILNMDVGTIKAYLRYCREFISERITYH